MKPPASAILDNLVWSTDGGVWAAWRVEPLPHAHTSLADKLAVHARIRGALITLPTESMLLSICERLDPLDVFAAMAEGIDLDERFAWRTACEATGEWLDQVPMHRRRYYVAARLPSDAGWRASVREAASSFTAAFGLSQRSIPPEEIDLRQRQASGLERRLRQHIPLSSVTAGELCWLYARAVRRSTDEPMLDERWEPAIEGDGPGAAATTDAVEAVGGRSATARRRRPRGVLAHLTDVVVREGGDADDEDRPRHRRYVRIDGGGRSSYQTVLAMADMPHYFDFPGGGGEWLYYVDKAGFPVDWCVRVRSIPNSDAQAKVRRKHRDLVGQIGEYDGEVTGAPPQLAEAIQAIDAERTELGANPSEAELHATILLSVAAPTLQELEDMAGTLTALFQPQEYGLARPTGGQTGLLRSMLPGTAAAPVCRDYTQFMLARDLAAGSPFCGNDVGDPTGLLLGVSLDGGTGTPVLFDPAFGPRVNTSPSLAAVGRLGSGKSYFLKRLCWDTLARGGQVVTIDRTTSGEYVRFAEAVPGRVQVVRLEAGADICLDPLRTFAGDERELITLGFLSLLAGCSAQSEEGAALAEAVDAVVERPGTRLGDVVDELERIASRPDPAAQAVARRLAHYRRSATGRLAFGDGHPLTLDADFVVFWMPNLALPDRETLASEHRSRMMLPEQVVSQALLYVVAAVGRQVVFRDPSRFAAALYDEAWAILASPHGQSLLIEGVRDGRKHNGAIWLASQHPHDFAASELHDLLGARFVFRQARSAIPAALRLLGIPDSPDARVALEQGLDNGQCLYRDVRERVGLVQVLPPPLPQLEAAFNTAPQARPGAEVGTDSDIDGGPLDADPLLEHDASIAVPSANLGELMPPPRQLAAAPIPADGESDVTNARRADASSEGSQAQAAAAARARARVRRRRTPLAQALDAPGDPT